jgi:hypothetical protein
MDCSVPASRLAETRGSLGSRNRADVSGLAQPRHGTALEQERPGTLYLSHHAITAVLVQLSADDQSLAFGTPVPLFTVDVVGGPSASGAARHRYALR